MKTKRAPITDKSKLKSVEIVGIFSLNFTCPQSCPRSPLRWAVTPTGLFKSQISENLKSIYCLAFLNFLRAVIYCLAFFSIKKIGLLFLRRVGNAGVEPVDDGLFLFDQCFWLLGREKEEEEQQPLPKLSTGEGGRRLFFPSWATLQREIFFVPMGVLAQTFAAGKKVSRFFPPRLAKGPIGWELLHTIIEISLSRVVLQQSYLKSFSSLLFPI